MRGNQISDPGISVYLENAYADYCNYCKPVLITVTPGKNHFSSETCSLKISVDLIRKLNVNLKDVNTAG